MFDKTFFRFAIGFAAIIAFSAFTLYFTGYWDQKATADQTAAVQ